MKVMRFMSLAEFEKYQAGEILTNDTKHQAYTDAEGFCFLNADNYDAQEAYEFISGIVSNDICAIFESDDIYKHGSGTYADPYGSFYSTISVEELCTTKYSKENLTLLKYCDNFVDNYEEDSSKHVFKWKHPSTKPRRKISIVDKNPPVLSNGYRSGKLDPVEEKFIEALKTYMLAKAPGMPADMFDGFSIHGSPSIRFERDFSRDMLSIEDIQFVRLGTLRMGL